MWDYEPDEMFDRRAKRYQKDHPRELQAVLTNLNILQKALQAGANPQKIPFGFIHVEQRGVVAIDQKGGAKRRAGQKGGKSLAQTRLYVYLDRDTETVHLVTLGDEEQPEGRREVCIGFRRTAESAERKEGSPWLRSDTRTSSR
jgi:hypothetical protein